ncbi:pre-mRNA splicing factor CLF1 [Ophiocordyceps camponoti-floridani]|uniref:Pre-mRNA splicing factor CLF1 n=1 Tax=Ophiocordyceps camponoti-floridani TaxID=2030778 RepID=A0A8H4QBY8_9HYPO|nr:pre-mRNA splicing factor CLF1 [Ophiocordyceps camponoti-floridani]
MSIPEPPASLDDACFAIHNGTLFAYSSHGFFSLVLDKGAAWRKLDMGVPVEGAPCLSTTPLDASQAALFVVGGRTDSGDYPGLQRYTYDDGQWSTIRLTDEVTKQRLGHAVTYVASDDVILMYAGHQDGTNGLSSQTFAIQSSHPFTVRGYESVAPPADSPVLFAWSASDAGMLTGGNGPLDDRPWLWNPSSGWRSWETTISAPFKVTPLTRLVPVDGDDGSKFLYAFDFGQSPVAVSVMVLQDGAGNPGPSTPSDVSRRVAVSRRDLGSKSLPVYNATLAPAGRKRLPAVASDGNGTVVFAGGGQDGALLVFNGKKNTWVDVGAMLGDGSKAFLAPTSASPTETPSSTSTSGASTSTTAAGNRGRTGPGPNALLGITLGCILGLMALLGIVLFLLRRRKKLRRRKAADDDSEEKEAEDMSPSTIPPKSHFRGHHPQASHESYSSMAILMGRVGKDRGLTRKTSHDTNRSSDSSLHKKFKSTISKPIPQPAAYPVLPGPYDDDKNASLAPKAAAAVAAAAAAAESNDTTRRSSGWNRYWSGGSALQILGLGPTRRNTTMSERSSHYSDSGNRMRQDSATVPPLTMDGRPEVNSVAVNSPTVARLATAEGMAGRIVRPTSPASSGYSSGIPESVVDGWDTASGGGRGGHRRAGSTARATTRPRAGPFLRG